MEDFKNLQEPDVRNEQKAAPEENVGARLYAAACDEYPSRIDPRLDGDVRLPSSAEVRGAGMARRILLAGGEDPDAVAQEISRALNRVSSDREVANTVSATNDILRRFGLSISAARVEGWNQATRAPYSVSIWQSGTELGNDGRQNRHKK